jgi:hypothetical protein
VEGRNQKIGRMVAGEGKRLERLGVGRARI